MEVNLTAEEKQELELQHKKERDRKKAYRMNVVLLRSEGWSQRKIAEALRISEDAVYDYLKAYIESKRLSSLNMGSSSNLNNKQTNALTEHLEKNTYDKVEQICEYVQSKYGVHYTASGMTKWLRKNGFSYKKPKGTPHKANRVQQEEFIGEYIKLVAELPKDEVIEFADGVHPTMATKITSGWIKKGMDKLISTTASRTRVNLFGSINLSTMSVTINQYKTINSETLENHFSELKIKYQTANKIHLFLDNGAYNTSAKTLGSAEKYGITLHHLPVYSPNLNPIERLWKVMNEYVRNNRFFKTAGEFREKILGFFQNKWSGIKDKMRGRINDNFQII
jgi:transposase